MIKIFSIRKRRTPKNLKEYMKQNGFKKQRQLAKFLGISETSLSKYLSGTRYPKFETAQRISKKTGIPLLDLFISIRGK